MNKLLALAWSILMITPLQAQSLITTPDNPITATQFNSLSTSVPKYVDNGIYIPMATLMSSYPCIDTTTQYLGNLAHVLDAWGSVKTSFVCESDGTNYYWRPQRTDYAIANNATGGSLSLTPLISAPIQILTGTLQSTMTITPSTVGAWPGAQFTIINKGVLGLFGINISGLTGGLLSILAGGSRTIVYTCPTPTTCNWQGS